MHHGFSSNSTLISCIISTRVNFTMYLICKNLSGLRKCIFHNLDLRNIAENGCTQKTYLCLIDWLHSFFMPYWQYFGHIVAATIYNKRWSFVKFWGVPGYPNEPSLHGNPVKQSFACQGGCYPYGSKICIMIRPG